MAARKGQSEGNPHFWTVRRGIWTHAHISGPEADSGIAVTTGSTQANESRQLTTLEKSYNSLWSQGLKKPGFF